MEFFHNYFCTCITIRILLYTLGRMICDERPAVINGILRFNKVQMGVQILWGKVKTLTIYGHVLGVGFFNIGALVWSEGHKPITNDHVTLDTLIEIVGEASECYWRLRECCNWSAIHPNEWHTWPTKIRTVRWCYDSQITKHLSLRFALTKNWRAGIKLQVHPNSIK